MVKDKKRLPGDNVFFGLLQFLVLMVIGLPILICVLLPITLVCIIITKIKNCFSSAGMEDTTKSLGEPAGNPKKLTSKDAREFDLIVFGATGFTGKLVATYLAKNYGLKGVKWAIAGRSQKKLEEIKAGLGDDVSSLQIVIADSSDVTALNKMVCRTKCIVSTAGPFLLYGSELVRQCAENGTHYCDITGETDWVRIMIDKYDDAARASGAKIVPFCGHDCVPWDLAVLKLSTEFKSQGDSLTEVHCYDEIRASASGGTMKTVFTALANRRKPKFALGFDSLLKKSDKSKSENTIKPKLQFLPGYASEHKSWVGFFVMSMVMANCVRRSNALNDYSKKLTYYEAQVYPNFFAAANTFIGMLILGTVIYAPPLSWLFLALGLIPSPGEGPSKEDMDEGFLKITTYGYGQDKAKAPKVATFYFPTDPGYRDTARMLAECGLLLATEVHKANKDCGILTPASCMGLPLIDRLVATGSSMRVSGSD